MTNWQMYKLSDVAKINQNTLSKKDKLDSIVYLDTGNMIDGKISDLAEYAIEKAPSRAKRKVQHNSIVYSMVRPNQLHYGLIKNPEENFIVSTGFAVIDCITKSADSRFIYYWLTQSHITEFLQAIAENSTSAYPAIRPEDLENLEIFLPPLAIQKKIAAVLGALDDKIELNNKINNNLEQQAQALFKSWFVDFEPFGGKMPEDWEVGNLLDIADYLNGLAMQKFRPEENEKGLPVLKIKELRQGFCDASSEFCSPNVKSEYIIDNGDVIFSWSGSLLVDFWCGGKCGLNQHLFKVLSKKFDKWFYYSWTKHHLDRFIAVAADKATTMGHIKRDELEKAEVIIPSSTDYKKIAKILSPIYDLIIQNRIENTRLAALRDTLLPKLMKGEIDVSNVDISELPSTDKLSFSEE